MNFPSNLNLFDNNVRDNVHETTKYTTNRPGLLQKRSRDLWSPHSQRVRARLHIRNWGILINEVAIRVVLHNITSGIPPVVKDLRAQDMSAHAPGQLVPLLHQPLMAQLLGVEVVHLEGAVVYMGALGTGAEEDAVVVHEGVAEVEVDERRHEDLVAFVLDVEEVGGDEVEGGGVELEEDVEFQGSIAEMAKLVIELVCADVYRDEQFLRRRSSLLLTLCTAAGPGSNRLNSRRRGFSPVKLSTNLSG